MGGGGDFKQTPYQSPYQFNALSYQDPTAEQEDFLSRLWGTSKRIPQNYPQIALTGVPASRIVPEHFYGAPTKMF